MDNLKEIRLLLKLKEIERYSIVKTRKESTAEHSWGCLILANYFFKKINYKIDQLKVLKMLTYHDLVEIISKDHYEVAENHKREIEEDEGFEILKKQIPLEIKKEYNDYFIEFEEEKTKEAQFSKAIDKLEVLIHMLDYKEEWIKQKWTEKKLRDFKEHYFIKIPEIYSFFNELIIYLKEKKYFIEE